MTAWRSSRPTIALAWGRSLRGKVDDCSRLACVAEAHRVLRDGKSQHNQHCELSRTCAKDKVSLVI
jgi:hypothetical protein